MKIKITQKHKSISPPCEFDLPQFSVLTGKNGSGKTHLLEAIADPNKSQVFLNGAILKNIRYIKFNGLNPKIEENCNPQIISQFIKNSWNSYDNAMKSILTESVLNHNIDRLFKRIGDKNIINYTSKIFEVTKKPLGKLTEDDYADNFDISFIAQTDFFTAQFALVFKNYHKRQEENNINEYYLSKGNASSRPVLSKNEFEDKFGTPPWDFVNKILLQTNIPYEVNSPIGTRVDSDFTFKLKDRTAGFEISSRDLSTGEKVLLSLALAIYNAGGDVGKPDLLLIDEPDAGLHPSMSKMMVDILNKNIVTDNKIQTVISTHSPTTIIASEGVSIYQMTRSDNIPRKISTQQAVEILSSDIPFLKISNDKRRQVFVESKYDVNYYELLTNIYSRIEKLPAEPIYLPAKTTSGSNCTEVIAIVNNLSKNGNDQVYGIIDWDNANSSFGRVIVLGESDRYAIENYLLDPFLMGILFIRERKLNFSDFGIASYTNYSDVSKLTQEEAQQIVNKVLLDLNLNSTNLVSSKLHNGWILNISKEFNFHKGHDLELLYKSKYPFLNAYKREDELKKDVIEKVINDYPHLTPIKIFEAIKKIK
ncbi:MAG: ATP-binding protein [Ignavibacteria bacterium]|nr:ATP-binding protein [Ignavibacteria bacterium]